MNKKAKKAKKLPRFLREVLVTRKNILDAFQFWDDAKMPKTSDMKRLENKLLANKRHKVTLQDQIIAARTVLGQIASREKAFDDELYDELAVESAKMLVTYNNQR